MPNVTFDGENRRININTGVTALNVVDDLYKAWKEWVVQGNNMCYPQAFRYVGGDSIGGANRISTYFFLMNGWKVKPYEGNHTLTVNGNLFSDDTGDAFVSTNGNYNVLKIMQTSSNATTIYTGGSALTAEEHTQLMSLLTKSFFLANQ